VQRTGQAKSLVLAARNQLDASTCSGLLALCPWRGMVCYTGPLQGAQTGVGYHPGSQDLAMNVGPYSGHKG